MTVRKALSTGILVLVLAQCNPTQAYDSLIYRTPFEARLVNNTINKTGSDFFSLFLAINTDSTECHLYDLEMKSFYAYLDPKLSRTRTDKQKATIIFKEVHSRFFRQYEENTLFEEIFEGGIYNCVTASMLYSLVLDRYQIPYEIKEKPTHIYLVAYSHTNNILFETTNPRGLFVPDDKTKRAYVDGLVNMKLVTREHVNAVGIAGAFNEFYYDKQNICLQQLAGLQYFNQALALYQATDIDAAIISALKANMLYPNTKNLYLKSSLIREALGNSNFDSMSDIRHLAEFASTATDVKDRKFVLGVFGQLLDDKLIKHGDEDFVKETYSLLTDRILDETMKLELRYNYALAMAHWHAMKGDMDEALRHAGHAHAINRDDVRLHDLVARSVALKSEQIRGEEKAIEDLHAYSETFPFLKSHKTFKTLMVYHYSFRAYSLFLRNSGDEAYQYLMLLEKDLVALGGNPAALQPMIGLAFAEAGAYHFRRRQFDKAKKILEKGLQIVPGHGELEERLRIVENEFKD